MLNKILCAVLVAVSLVFAGCVTEEPVPTADTDIEADCTPGEAQACVCTSGLSGAQTCNADGTGFGTCHCDPGSGGSGTGGDATGGTGGSGGSGTGNGGSGGQGGDDIGAVCVPGHVDVCPCGGDPQGGTQTCKDDGSGYGACTCNAPPVCVPGHVDVCPCGGDPQGGTQTCKDDGSGYGACDCSPQQVCTPNTTSPCPCAGGGTGTQTCAADGMSLGACGNCQGGGGASGIVWVTYAPTDTNFDPGALNTVEAHLCPKSFGGACVDVNMNLVGGAYEVFFTGLVSGATYTVWVSALKPDQTSYYPMDNCDWAKPFINGQPQELGFPDLIKGTVVVHDGTVNGPAIGMTLVDNVGDAYKCTRNGEIDAL